MEKNEQENAEEVEEIVASDQGVSGQQEEITEIFEAAPNPAPAHTKTFAAQAPFGPMSEQQLRGEAPVLVSPQKPASRGLGIASFVIAVSAAVVAVIALILAASSMGGSHGFERGGRGWGHSGFGESIMIERGPAGEDTGVVQMGPRMHDRHRTTRDSGRLDGPTFGPGSGQCPMFVDEDGNIVVNEGDGAN